MKKTVGIVVCMLLLITNMPIIMSANEPLHEGIVIDDKGCGNYADVAQTSNYDLSVKVVTSIIWPVTISGYIPFFVTVDFLGLENSTPCESYYINWTSFRYFDGGTVGTADRGTFNSKGVLDDNENRHRYIRFAQITHFNGWAGIECVVKSFHDNNSDNNGDLFNFRWGRFEIPYHLWEWLISN